MAQKIGLVKMHRAMIDVCLFIEQKWSDESAKKRALRHAEAALRHWSRIGTARNSGVHFDRAIACLELASKVEKKEVERIQKSVADALYGEKSKTPFSDAIAAQKQIPDQEVIWAFKKMLQEYRKEVEEK